MSETALELKARILYLTDRILRWKGHPSVLQIFHDLRDEYMVRLASTFDVWTWIEFSDQVEFVTRFTWEARAEDWLKDRIQCFQKLFKEAA